MMDCRNKFCNIHTDNEYFSYLCIANGKDILYSKLIRENELSLNI